VVEGLFDGREQSDDQRDDGPGRGVGLCDAARRDDRCPGRDEGGAAAVGDHDRFRAGLADGRRQRRQLGRGIDGEVTVWEGRYSLRNFIGRAIGMGLLVIAWATLAIYAYWNLRADQPLTVLSILTGLILLFLGLSLLYRVILAHYGHFYRLTTRRLFVSSGLFNRRRDMMELLKVQDVYTKQTLFQRWLSLGTVVVVSSDNKLPMAHLPGVADPKGVMDTIWHYARAERDTKAVKVDQV